MLRWFILIDQNATTKSYAKNRLTPQVRIMLMWGAKEMQLRG